MEHTVGEAARRYERLKLQRRYEMAVSALGLEALLRPYAVNETGLRVPRQSRRLDDDQTSPAPETAAD